MDRRYPAALQLPGARLGARAVCRHFADKDYDRIVDDIIPDRGPEVTFGLERLPKDVAEAPSVRLISIAKTAHVNALASDQPLTFEPNGLTIVYGDSGSGKSGYARLLKRITRSRHQEEVLSDVFSDTAMEKPTAGARWLSSRCRCGRSPLPALLGHNHSPSVWTPTPVANLLSREIGCGKSPRTTTEETDHNPELIAASLWLLVQQDDLRIRPGGYLVKPGCGGVVVESAETRALKSRMWTPPGGQA